MFLKNVRVKDFRAIREVNLSLEGKKRLLLIGDNASGKTSLLQAITLTLGLATGNLRNPAEFSKRWKGFYLHRLSPSALVEIEVERDEEEMQVLEKEIWPLVKKYDPHFRVEPDFDSKVITLKWTKFRRKPFSKPKNPGSRFALSGRTYVKALWHKHKAIGYKETVSFFRKLGDIFWFDQRRSFESWWEVFPLLTEEVTTKSESPTWEVGVQKARELLQHWWSHYVLEKEDSLLFQLQQRIRKIFQAEFLGPVEPRDEKSWYFILERNGKRYDIGEMSSGEEAILYLLLNSLRVQVNRSVIIVDEPELHLNPKEQRWLMMNLEEFFPNCQIIMASHSPYIAKFFKENEIVELKDGEVVEWD